MKNNKPVTIGYQEDALDRRERLLAARKPKIQSDVLKDSISSLGLLWAKYESDWNLLKNR